IEAVLLDLLGVIDTGPAVVIAPYVLIGGGPHEILVRTGIGYHLVLVYAKTGKHKEACAVPPIEVVVVETDIMAYFRGQIGIPHHDVQGIAQVGHRLQLSHRWGVQPGIVVDAQPFAAAHSVIEAGAQKQVAIIFGKMGPLYKVLVLQVVLFQTSTDIEADLFSVGPQRDFRDMGLGIEIKIRTQGRVEKVVPAALVKVPDRALTFLLVVLVGVAKVHIEFLAQFVPIGGPDLITVVRGGDSGPLVQYLLAGYIPIDIAFRIQEGLRIVDAVVVVEIYPHIPSQGIELLHNLHPVRKIALVALAGFPTAVVVGQIALGVPGGGVPAIGRIGIVHAQARLDRDPGGFIDIEFQVGRSLVGDGTANKTVFGIGKVTAIGQEVLPGNFFVVVGVAV